MLLPTGVIICILLPAVISQQPPPIPQPDPCYTNLREWSRKYPGEIFDGSLTFHPWTIWQDSHHNYNYGVVANKLDSDCSALQYDNYWTRDSCLYEGKVCPPEQFAHGPEQLRRKRQAEPDITETVWGRQFSFDLWANACKTFYNETECLRTKNPACTDEDFPNLFVREIRTYFYRGVRPAVLPEGNSPEELTPIASRRAFATRICDGPNLKTDLSSLIDQGFNASCIYDNDEIRKQFESCGRAIQEDWDSETLFSFPRFWELLSAAALQCVRGVLATSKCSDGSKTLLLHAATLMVPGTVDVGALNVTLAPSIVNLAVGHRCSVGTFGDPHLRMCDEPKAVTCLAPGNQTYLSNPFLHVAVHHKKVNDNWPGATAVDAVEIRLTDVETGASVTYTADDSQLPYTFTDGTTSAFGGAIDIQQGSNAVVGGGIGLRIVHRHIGMVLWLRSFGEFYIINMRTAKSLISQSSGILAIGCPPSETNDGSGLNRRKRGNAAAACQTACDSVSDSENLPDGTQIKGLYSACVFDCLQTGGTELVNMTISMLENEKAILETDDEARKSAKTVSFTPGVQVPGDETSAANRHSALLSATCTALLVYLALLL